MNSTPQIDQMSQAVPLEGLAKLRMFAFLRLCVVGVAILVCGWSLVCVGAWSPIVVSLIIVSGLWAGNGQYSDAIEPVWQALGPTPRLAVGASAVVLFVGVVLSQGHVIWDTALKLWALVALGVYAYGLVSVLRSPLRAANYRQCQAFLRSVPRNERFMVRNALERHFESGNATDFR